MVEINADTLSGPTHHFGGLSVGNTASTKNEGILSHPKKAALQGLEKMKLLFELGVPQLIFPPHLRPHTATLKQLGFSGSEQNIIESAYKTHPELLFMCSSSSSMWTANSATVTPSMDALDGKVHITSANLASNLHRAIEVSFTEKVLRAVFSDSRYFTHHQPMPSSFEFFDEGAANHTRFMNGLQLFVYGRSLQSTLRPTKYPARQTKEAQMAIARLHHVPPKKQLFFQQNPAAIDAGVFHNDVISTGYGNLFLYHEDAFVETNKKIKELERHFPEIECYRVTKKELSLEQAVKSYLFNSQIVRTEPNQKLLLICPYECKSLAIVQKLTPRPFDDVLFVDLRQSMMNGGGPACLRLRVEVTQKELNAIHKGVVFSLNLYKALQQVINKWYPDTFSITDLLDSDFRRSCKTSHEKIVSLLQLEL